MYNDFTLMIFDLRIFQFLQSKIVEKTWESRCFTLPSSYKKKKKKKKLHRIEQIFLRK